MRARVSAPTGKTFAGLARLSCAKSTFMRSASLRRANHSLYPARLVDRRRSVEEPARILASEPVCSCREDDLRTRTAANFGEAVAGDGPLGLLLAYSLRRIFHVRPISFDPLPLVMKSKADNPDVGCAGIKPGPVPA